MNKKIAIVSHGLWPPNIYKNLAKTSKNPVLTNDLLRINIAPIVMTALLLKPDKAASMDIISKRRSKPTEASAVTSNGRISKIKKTMAKQIIKNNMIWLLSKMSI